MEADEKSKKLRGKAPVSWGYWVTPAVIFTVTLSLVLFVRNLGWDDGAITLAFARTFAHSGKIALTPISDTVEGFSTPLWFFLLAATEKLFHLQFDAFIRSSQIGAAICSSLAAVTFYRLMDRDFSQWFRTVAALLLGLSSPFLNESVNGMEMTLLALLTALVLLLIQEDRRGLLVVVVALGTATRFEALFYFLSGSVLLWFFGARSRRGLAILTALSSVASFSFLEIWRFLCFGLWIPNTVQAKRWPPYSNTDLHQALSLRALGLIELPILFSVPLIWVAFYVLRRRSLGISITKYADDSNGMYLFAFGYVSSVILFSALAGHNIGYLGRMQLSAFIPFLLILLHLARTAIRPFHERAAVLVLLLWWASDLRALRMEPIQLSLRDQHTQGQRDLEEGTSWQRHISFREPHILLSREPANWDGTTPQNYATTGLAVDRLRKELGLNSLVLITPDVGGSALCCEHLRIVDSALLTNQELAAKGYVGAAALFERENPEVIETHSIWAKLNGFYNMPFFRKNYVPVTFLGNYLWLRKDLVPRLLAGDAAKYSSCTDVYQQGFRYFERYQPTDVPDDLEACTKLSGKVLMLSLTGTVRP